MCHFIMTNGSQFSTIYETSTNDVINELYFNTLGAYFLLQVKHVIVYPIRMPKY